MPERVVQADKQGNLSVKLDGRKYVAPQGTKALVGMAVNVNKTYRSDDERLVRPAWGTRQRGTTWTVAETWTTSDTHATKAPKEGIREVKRRLGAVNFVAIISDGSGTQKLSPQSVSKGDMYLAMNGGATLSFTEWDSLVKEIENARMDAPLDKIRKEAELEAAMDEIRRKYLP